MLYEVMVSSVPGTDLALNTSLLLPLLLCCCPSFTTASRRSSTTSDLQSPDGRPRRGAAGTLLTLSRRSPWRHRISLQLSAAAGDTQLPAPERGGGET